MNPYQMFQTNTEAEQDKGIELDYGSFSIRIVRAGGANKKFGETLNRKLKPYRRQMENDTMDNDVAARLMAEAYAETVILGWEGVTDETGAVLPFSRQACVKLLTDLPELFRDIQGQANSAANFRQADLEASAKNSGAASASTSKTGKS